MNSLDDLQYEIYKLEYFRTGSPLILTHIQDLHKQRDEVLHEEIERTLANRCYLANDWTAYNRFMEM